MLKHFPEDQPSIGQEVWIFEDPENLNVYIESIYRPDLLPLVFFVNKDLSPLPYNECYWFPGPDLAPPRRT